MMVAWYEHSLEERGEQVTVITAWMLLPACCAADSFSVKFNWRLTAFLDLLCCWGHLNVSSKLCPGFRSEGECDVQPIGRIFHQELTRARILRFGYGKSKCGELSIPHHWWWLGTCFRSAVHLLLCAESRGVEEWSWFVLVWGLCGCIRASTVKLDGTCKVRVGLSARNTTIRFQGSQRCETATFHGEGTSIILRDIAKLYLQRQPSQTGNYFCYTKNLDASNCLVYWN